ncbi:MAG: acetyl-CoA decarbonylase/synthase complex subunit gamma [Candidatus Omnitrophica bacterium]|nr:acetyl-CoA decarbonylase/synthase complex subunit gamma [Candidatus Omnitrophota bacterium]MBU4303382.1 acetyl-CoA decarbonylase/synthase complex subunit gamma [Candidatus Omnitrophota bacterium]MBU4418448.1 acetyl-CoA decarbonylase/synthase complex subunit gamma [Candidatus Omnitrophota bacterium]MBU4468768.1 acetyl-CoA decarbonylase/synthase complex subunit gamma [Candidatus Omnitrophota bacterium]MCG2708055.1 acetyl-CoA decarbonylase/synthase complex subunit gamma [Candidatus Omnitrophota
MALSGLDIYKLLPKTNCRQCGFATCLAFAMQLAKKTVAIEKCPFISPEAKSILEAQALPAIKLITLGSQESKFDIGNETVMFRHEEKFRNPAGVGFIIEDGLSDTEIRERLRKINQLKFERVGQQLSVNLVALKQNKDASRYLEAVKLLLDNTTLPMMLMSKDLAALKQAVIISQERKPLLYSAQQENFAQIGALAKEFQLPLVVMAQDIDQLRRLTKELNGLGVNELILDTGIKPLADKIWDLTQLRRQALKRSNRALGYPTLAIVEQTDPYLEAMEAGAYIAKYAGLVLIKGWSSWEVLSILTLRQNIYTDPQKPLQIDPKLYSVGQVNRDSPVLVTTNFSLSYYTVLGEVEASKIPAYILSVDTQGMSVLTAWAAEKFNAEAITKSLETCGVKEVIRHKDLIIPGYVAMISGDLQDQSGFRIIVGPKEAAGIPAFLKKLN